MINELGAGRTTTQREGRAVNEPFRSAFVVAVAIHINYHSHSGAVNGFRSSLPSLVVSLMLAQLARYEN